MSWLMTAVAGVGNYLAVGNPVTPVSADQGVGLNNGR